MSVIGLHEIATALEGHRFNCTNEYVLQASIEAVLDGLDCGFIREYRLGNFAGRIDFYYPDMRIGIEVKVRGTLDKVYKQLKRYAAHPDIDVLILVSSRRNVFRGIPPSIDGVEIYCISTWRANL